MELVGYLPEFLDGLFSYLSDLNPDVRTATLAVLGEFLREIKDVLTVQKEKGIWENSKEGLKAPDTSMVSDVKDTDSVTSLPVSNEDLSTYFSGQGALDFKLILGITLNFGKMTEILLPHILSQGI